MIIRARKLLERVYGTSATGKSTVLTVSPYRVDRDKRRVTTADGEIELTAKEFDLLLLFVAEHRRAFSREQILTQIWGDSYFGSDRVVDDLVRRLRKKLPDLNVETMYGFGYRLVL